MVKYGKYKCLKEEECDSIQCTSPAGLSKELKQTTEVLNLDNRMLSKQQILLKQKKKCGLESTG